MGEWSLGQSKNSNNFDENMPDLATAEEERIITCTDFDYEQVT